MPAPELRIVFTPDGAAAVESAVVRTERAAAKAQAESNKAAAATAATTDRIAGASRQASFALETMARQGQVAGEPLRQLLSIGGEMAFMFGAGGVVAGAMASLGLAVFNTFQRAKEEAKKAQEDMLKDFRSFGRQLRDADVGSAASIAARLYSGDQYAETEMERMGLSGVSAELTRLVSVMKEGVQQHTRYNQLTAMATELNNKYALAMQRVKTTMADVVGGQQRSLSEANAWQGAFSRQLRGPAGIGSVTRDGGTSADLDDLLRAYLGEVQARASVPAALQNNPLKEWFDLMKKQVADSTAAMKEQLAAEGAAVGAVFSNALADGLATAVRTRDLGAGFKQLTAGLLAGIGGMMIHTGQAMVKFGALIDAFKKALLGFFGGSAIAAGVALIAIGAGLQGLSGALGNTGTRVASGGDRSVGGGLGIPGTGSIPVSLPRQPWEAQAAGMGPAMARPSLVFAGTVFGAKDPALPRYLFDALEEGARRGFRLPSYAVGAG